MVVAVNISFLYKNGLFVRGSNIDVDFSESYRENTTYTWQKTMLNSTALSNFVGKSHNRSRATSTIQNNHRSWYWL